MEDRKEFPRQPTEIDQIQRLIDRFDDGKLNSCGCMERYNLHRTEMEQNKRENAVRNFDMSNHTEYEEQVIQSMLFSLFHTHGYKLRPNETAEQLIIRALDDGVVIDDEARVIPQIIQERE